MERVLLRVAAATVFVISTTAAFAQEVKLRLVSFVPPNTAFGIPAKRWVDEVNRRGKGILHTDMVGPEAVRGFLDENRRV